MDKYAARPADDLSKCLEANDELREENAHLRNAAGAFGELAERLNTILREDRRNHLQPDRRATDRHEGDRRSQPAAEPAATR